jgi:hypothetical protein
VHVTRQLNLEIARRQICRGPTWERLMVRDGLCTVRAFVLIVTVLGGGQACSPVQNEGLGNASRSDSTRSTSDHNRARSDTATLVDRRTEINPTPEEVTTARFRILGGEIRSFSNRTGRLPLRLGDILSNPVEDNNLRPQRWWLLDGWERPIRYEVNSNTYVLLSSGPDGQFGTTDDLRSQGNARSGSI